MRYFLIAIAFIAGFLAALAFYSGFSKGTDIQLIAAGVFSTVFVICLGFAGTMTVLEEIRDADKPKEPSELEQG